MFLGPFWPICSVNGAVKSTLKLKIRYDQWKIFTAAYYRDTVLMQEMLSFTGTIAVMMLTFCSKTVRQHIMHVRHLSYCSVKLGSSSVRTNGRSVTLILILILLITYMGRDAGSCVSDNAWLTPGSGFSQSIVDDAIDEWCKRLQTWVDEKGGHFEHLLWYYDSTVQKNWIIFRLCYDNFGC